eukprot:TRINITY_DN56691_c0_g1_i1.p1 TRINITY_DN56691_c0_g1~~TRINITY_DN56691_c0_g1_i1.p1  ORF type:complete len:113 (-),score=32.68 TRINITY_DN56691_c0_g1_i1:155-493(-)
MFYYVFFFFKQKTAYEMLRSLVGSEMCIRDSHNTPAAYRFLGRLMGGCLRSGEPLPLSLAPRLWEALTGSQGSSSHLSSIHPQMAEFRPHGVIHEDTTTTRSEDMYLSLIHI